MADRIHTVHLSPYVSAQGTAEQLARMTSNPQTTAARDVLAERARQVSTEGWTPEHDDTNADGEMAQAAACYALNAAGWKTEALRGCWPIKWWAAWFKPTTRRRDLVKAGALILAEIERLDRAEARASRHCDTCGRIQHAHNCGERDDG